MLRVFTTLLKNYKQKNMNKKDVLITDALTLFPPVCRGPQSRRRY